jgi:hypothetical protein
MIEMFESPIGRSFLTTGEHENEDEIRPSPIILPLYFHPLAPGQEQMRILLISSPKWVTETTHDMHADLLTPKIGATSCPVPIRARWSAFSPDGDSDRRSAIGKY